MTARAPEKPPSRHALEAKFFLLALFACTGIIAFQFFRCDAQGRCIFAEDFEVFYGPARQMATHTGGMIYPIFQAKEWVDTRGANGIFHYSLYPPSSLLLFYPLGYVSQNAALALWFCVQLGTLVLSLVLVWRMKPPERIFAITLPAWAAIIIVIPFVMMTLFAGQVGILCAAFFLLAFALRNSRPILAGFMLALLAVKPQLALMLPVLLLAERNFKMLFWAGGFFMILCAASAAVFGAASWRDYFEMLSFSPQLLAIAPTQLLTSSLSPVLALRMLDFNAQTSLALQAIISLGAVALSFVAFKNTTESEKLMLAATSTFLLPPYSFHYDAVLLSFACLPLLSLWLEGTIAGSQRVALILLAFIPLVAVKLQAMSIPYGFPAIVISFFLLWAHARRGAVARS